MDLAYDNNDAEEWARYNFFPPEEPVVVPPSIGGEPAPNPGGIPTNTSPPAYGPGVYMDPNSRPPFDPPAGTDWAFDPANGWYPRATSFGPPGGPTGGGDDPGGTDGGGFGDFGYLTEPFTGTPPTWQGWTPEAAPQIVRPDPFSYREFEMPTTDSIYADPSYKFRFGEGQRALEQGAASQGILRTGGTLKDLVNYGQNAASQEYGNIVDRAVNTHNLGLNQALGTYATNWGVGRDVLDREIDIWGAKNTASQRENELTNRRGLDNFLAEFDIFDRNRKRASDVLFGAANVGSANA